MCGICGFVDFSSQTSPEIISKMVDTLHHRGPNDKGSLSEYHAQAQVGLGHTRLSVLDLSTNATQPMHYEQFSIVFNGEIYNYKEIRTNLIEKGHQFNTTSDTEVILHAFMEWREKAVDQFIGMFAFALFDRKTQEIFLFRDRPGVKPLFYYWHNGIFIFASELKSLIKHPGIKKEIDVKALKLYFQLGYVPAPYAIYKNTFKVFPGTCLKVDLKDQSVQKRTYWNAFDHYQKEKEKINYQEAKEHLKGLLKSSASYRMVSDVPVGVFLSGGYDSSLVTSILQENQSTQLKTFTIGFKEGNNEAPYAKSVASLLGTDHTEYFCTSQEAQEIIPQLPYFFDEPFSDSSAIPTILVSRLARQTVTVALSADGGDELFAGYERYKALLNNLQWLTKIPDFFQIPTSWFLKMFSSVFPTNRWRDKHMLQGVSEALKKRDFKDKAAILFRFMNSAPQDYLNRLFLKSIDGAPTDFDLDASSFQDWLDVVLSADYKMYLQNDILTKVDRATMSVSLEGREPLLDHRLLEFTASLPSDYKYSATHGKKRILKDIVHDYLPEKLMKRPKAGFSIPVISWLKDDLDYLVEEFLNENALKASGLFNVSFILAQVKLFQEDKLYYKNFIWRLLMFQMWFFKWNRDTLD